MKKMIYTVLFFTACIPFISCNKENSCDNCISNPPTTNNKPPIASAGPDQIITLPVNNVEVNGIGSSDPDGTIVSYLWTKISGSSSFHIVNPGSSKTIINQLAQRIYQFELTVKDNGGLMAKDTLQITVNSASQQLVSCNSQLTHFGNLSIPRANPLCAAAGNKILFAGGYTNTTPVGLAQNSSRVDIYDMISKTWSTAELSQPRHIMAAVTSGSKIFFAGGYSNGISSSRVDIYDASTNSWSIAELSVGRGHIGAASAGNKVLFAGGMNDNYDGVDVVDIYDVSTNTWSTNYLNGEKIVSATSLNNKIYFAGRGTNEVEVYDGSSNLWSVITRSEPTFSMANIAFGNTIYWAGGNIGSSTSDKVEMYNVITGKSTFHQLSAARKNFQAVLKNNRILFYTGYPYSNNVDVYDINIQTWSACSIVQSPNNAGIISADNKVYVAGGDINGALTNQVWLLDF